MDSDPFMPTGNCRPASTRTTLPLLCSPRSKEDFYSPRYVRIPVHSKLRSIPSSPLPSADEPKRVRSQPSPRSAHGSWMMHVHPHDAPLTWAPYEQRRLTLADILVRLLTMTTLPLGEVKTHLSELVGRVHDHHERVTVTVHGHPSAVLVAVEDLERLEETLAILRDAGTMDRLAESDAELGSGEPVSAA